MTTFVLVHGAWHGAWCWRDVEAQLRAAGHDVLAPCLTGVGERAHLAAPSVGLETHVGDVLGLFERNELADVVLVGHSYGGMVITGAADRIPGSIRTLVYLDAFIPRDGQALLSLQAEQARAATVLDAIANGDGWRVSPRAPEYFGVRDPAHIERIKRHCTAQPLLTFMQPVREQGNWRNIARKVYIRAKGHPTPVFAPFGDMARDAGDWDYHEVACGHEVMIEAPDELAALLLKLA